MTAVLIQAETALTTLLAERVPTFAISDDATGAGVCSIGHGRSAFTP
jgi:hypothetical protein